MNKFTLKDLLKTVPVLLVTGALLLLVGCNKGDSPGGKPADVDYYTCTMHPSVKKQSPTDKCPICGMDLVPVKKKSTASHQHDEHAESRAVSNGAADKSAAPGKPADVDYYTCTMHPSVRMQNPTDKCPICGMNLVPVKKKPGAAHDHGAQVENQSQASGADNETAPSEFVVPVERQQQFGVSYSAAEKRPFKQTIRAAGTVAYDKKSHWDYVARVDGYVKELFVFSRGELVEKGAKLLTLYSPDLLTTQNEFVQVLKMRDEMKSTASAVKESTEHLYQSAKERLRLWNISEDQIAELEKTRKPQETLALFSPFKGVVQEIRVDQGSRVMNGDHLVDIADLSTVWVWAQFYQDELPLLSKGSSVTITSSSYPGEKLSGTVAVIDPFITDATRTGRVRIDVENPGLKLRPDMYVDVELEIEMGEGLAIPAAAVLPTGKHNVVFLDKGEGKIEPRFIELGRKFGDYYEVRSGLSENERVMTSANFLIDAEAKVQGALKSF